MKPKYKFPLILFCILISLPIMAQKDDKTSNEDRERAERNTAKFSLDYFNKSSYYVITLEVKEGKVVTDNARVQEVKGSMPYQTGNLQVKVLDNQGKVLSDYYMQDPLISRSCEGEKSELQPVLNGTIQLALPQSNSISTIELTREKQRVQQINVEEVMKKLQEPRENDNQNDDDK